MRQRYAKLIGVTVMIMIVILSYAVIHAHGRPPVHHEMKGTDQQMADRWERVEQERVPARSLDPAVQNSAHKSTALTHKDSKSAQGDKKEEAPKSHTGEGITAIGDSVLVGVEPFLKERLPAISVDGKVGRQMSQAQDVIDELKEQGRLGDQIIIELGTNGPFNKKQLHSLLESLSDAKQVLLVTTRVPKDWQDTVNRNIEEAAREFSNVKVVDWYSASEGKDEYFYQDGVHLKPDGGKFYASLLVEALQE